MPHRVGPSVKTCMDRSDPSINRYADKTNKDGQDPKQCGLSENALSDIGGKSKGPRDDVVPNSRDGLEKVREVVLDRKTSGPGLESCDNILNFDHQVFSLAFHLEIVFCDTVCRSYSVLGRQ